MPGFDEIDDMSGVEQDWRGCVSGVQKPPDAPGDDDPED